jgi:hypothetical protein
MSHKVEADNLVSLRQRNCDIRLVLIGRHHLCHSGTSSASVSGAVRPQWRRGPTFSSTARIRADMACICTFSESMVRSKLVHHAKRKSSFSSLVIAAYCLPAAGAAIAASHVLPAAGRGFHNALQNSYCAGTTISTRERRSPLFLSYYFK